MKILVAGPYRCGTNDDPRIIKNNFRKLEAAALRLFHLGHIPVIGEWIAWPVAELKGLINPVAGTYEGMLFPISPCHISKCNAVLRLDGASEKADKDIKFAKEIGLKIFYSLEDIEEPVISDFIL
jgi:hypothetical protein